LTGIWTADAFVCAAAGSAAQHEIIPAARCVIRLGFIHSRKQKMTRGTSEVEFYRKVGG
jgi:hypothetical protein